MAKRRQSFVASTNPEPAYDVLVAGISAFLESARRKTARVVNNLLTSTYWEIGRRIVEFEQGGKLRAVYGEKLIEHLAQDLSAKHGRGFGVVNLTQMRKFYQLWPSPPILQTPSEESSQGQALVTSRQPAFPLPWSHYVRLLAVENPHARMFYEAEAIRGSWSVRQMDRQINSQFYERTALSKRKAAILTKGQIPKPEDAVTVAEELRDPYLLEFLDLKDEYSENDLEEALIRHLETFLLELGDDFAFVARQRRLLIDVKWFRVDLIFFHRGLRSLLLVDLKLGAFSHADAGQMHLYLNYAKCRAFGICRCAIVNLYFTRDA
jgi:predicted nuclease of restriction endonuclease-like (RecB) superfamily